MSRQAHLSISPGVFTAMSNMNDNRAYYTFNGDLNQMGQIESFLRERGFPVVKNNVYPGFPQSQLEQYKRALKAVFDARVPGWWNQRERLIEHGICTDEEYRSALDREV